MEPMKPESAAVALGIHTNTVRKYAPRFPGVICQEKPMTVDIEKLWEGLIQVDKAFYGKYSNLQERLDWVKEQGERAKQHVQTTHSPHSSQNIPPVLPVQTAQTAQTANILPVMNEIQAGIHALAKRDESSLEKRLLPIVEQQVRRRFRWQIRVLTGLVCLAVGGIGTLGWYYTRQLTRTEVALALAGERQTENQKINQQLQLAGENIITLTGSVATLTQQNRDLSEQKQELLRELETQQQKTELTLWPNLIVPREGSLP